MNNFMFWNAHEQFFYPINENFAERLIRTFVSQIKSLLVLSYCLKTLAAMAEQKRSYLEVP